MYNPPGYRVSPSEARQRRQQQQQQQQHYPLHPILLARRFYWWIIFPSLLYITYNSLMDLLFQDSLYAPSRYTLMQQQQQYQNQRNSGHPPHPAAGGRNSFWNHQERYPSGYRSMPGMGRQSNPWNAGDSASNDHHSSNDNDDPGSSWWGESTQLKKPSYPDFVMDLEKARMALRDIPINVTTTSSSTTSSLWKPAPPPPDQPINFTKPILPPPTKLLKSKSNILIMVLSGPDNFIRRQAIRKTWATDNVIFVLGQANCHSNDTDTDTEVIATATTTTTTTTTTSATSSCPQQDALLQEQSVNQDLLEVPFVDDYTKLPEKVVQMYQYVIAHQQQPQSQEESSSSSSSSSLSLQHIQWLIKADDDMYVRPDMVERYLKKFNPRIPMIIGKIVPHSPVAREGKWAEIHYHKSHYPYWPQGSAGHVVSLPVAQYIVQHSSSLRRYQGEDVSIGIWMNEAFQAAKSTTTTNSNSSSSVLSSSLSLQDLTYIQAKRMITNEGTQRCGIPKCIMIGHALNPEEVYDCHLKFHNDKNDDGTNNNSNSFVEDNAWLDDPAGWKEQIAAESAWEEGGGWGDILG